MKLTLQRRPDGFTDISTIGNLSLDGEFFCNTIELSCRRANPMGKVAIPPGTYKVILGPTSIGNRFRPPLPILPLLVGVVGRTGIRIHPANEAKELEGCIAPGIYDPAVPNFVSNSRVNFDKIFKLMQDAADISITVIGGTP